MGCCFHDSTVDGYVGVWLGAGHAGGSDAPFAENAEQAAFSQTCDHYRARGGPEGTAGPQAFAAFLADVCAAALVAVDRGTPSQRSHSELLLARIALLRNTIEEMNADRAVVALDDPAEYRPPVTASGEFLIAHRMGLLVIYDAWLDTGVHFSLASDP